MNLTETAKLLAFISELDYRRFTEETAVAWHEVLGKYDYQDCRDAVIAHNTSSGEFLKPGHIGKIIHANRKRRLSGVPVTLVANVDDRRGIESTAEDHDHYKRVRAEIREAIANGSLTTIAYQWYWTHETPWDEFKKNNLGPREPMRAIAS
ncbi:hypothetical protein M3G43_02760 [Brevibacterium casei]|uniref:Uncharacterized protein n=1 Tax=Brevibacterium casei TaxID=33889 RepID=A0A449D7C4_9MICO|nr:hypothetical protein [Brevibacterium casei]MCT1446185.1 hypothetical protein [Brevibacterium casei]MCT2357054.1 hypothetical protein [Brevibacterium casei]VEW13529.1 Uncharacterised protein [Brevibacterium casei]